MAASLIEHGAIRTTEAKAKELRRFVERLITIAKQGTLHARRRVISLLQNRHAVDEEGAHTEPWVKKSTRGKTIVDVLFDEIAPRFAARPGGYTRIVRLSDRRIGDAGVQVLLQLVEEVSSGAREDSSGGGRRRKRAIKRHESASAIEEPQVDEAEEEAEEEAGDEEEAPESGGPAEDEDTEKVDDEAEGDDEKK